MFPNDNHKQSLKNKELKIVHEDSFNFIDDDDEPIVLYEDYIHQNAKESYHDAKDDVNDYVDEIDNFSYNNSNFDIESLFQEKDVDENKNISNNIQTTSNINNELNQPEKNVLLNENSDSKSLNDDFKNIDEQNNKINKINDSIENKSEIDTKENLIQENSVYNSKIISNDIENNEITETINNTDKSFVNETQNKHNEQELEIVENIENKNNQPQAKKTFFINPKQNNKENDKVDDYVVYKAEDNIDTSNIKKEDYSKYIIISSRGIKNVLNAKFIFSLLHSILWFILLGSVVLILIFGVISQIKNKSNFKFSNWDYIPTIITLLLSGSFVGYHLFVAIRYKMARNEFIDGKKIDENDLIKVTKIFRLNKMFLNFLLWFLLTICFLFGLTLLIFYFVNNKSFTFSSGLKKQVFDCSIIAFSFLFIVILVYIISYIVMNNIIEKDNDFEKNQIISYYKDINKKSFKIGLIVFLSSTIIGIIIYLITIAIMKRRKYSKQEKALYLPQ